MKLKPDSRHWLRLVVRAIILIVLLLWPNG